MDLDSRTLKLQPVWRVAGNAADGPSVLLTASNTVRASYPAGQQLGQQWYLLHSHSTQPHGYYLLGQDERFRVARTLFLPRVSQELGYSTSLELGQCFRRITSPLAGLAQSQAEDLGFGIPRNQSTSKHEPYLQVVVTGAAQTHTIRFNLQAGGIIDYWRVQVPAHSLDGQVVNRFDSYIRGIGTSLCWVDDHNGELIRHTPHQGGSYYSLPSGSGTADAYTSHGSPVVSTSTETLPNGSVKVTVITAPLELDPDGAYSSPFVASGHGGGKYLPILWKNFLIKTELTLNWGGVEGRHLMVVTTTVPEDLTTAWFDLAISPVACLDPGVLDNLRSFDVVSGTDTLLSNGVIGSAYYKANYRRYSMNHGATHGDDEGNIGASLVPSGRGVIAGVSTAGSNLAWGWFSDMASASVPVTGTQSLARARHGTCFSWLQKRGVSTGQDGQDVIAIGIPGELSNRWHNKQERRVLLAGETVQRRVILTGRWADVKTMASTINSTGVFGDGSL